MLDAIFEYQFMQHAVIACVLASIVCGLIGVIVVEKKLIMMSGGIAHTAYGGVGLGYLLGFEPMLGAVLFSVGAAVGVGSIKRRGGVNTDVIIALLWSMGMALGTAFIGFMEGYPPDMSSYLFGNILSVTKSDLLMMVCLTVVVCLTVLILFNDWKAFLFDDCFSKIIGLKTTFLEYLLLILVALTVVVLIRVAGIILVIALLTAPAATASLLSDKLRTRMLLAIAIGLFYCFAGLWISYVLGIASGATIIIFSVVSYAIAYFFRYILGNYSPKHKMVK
ncbi:MAG: metal ABC transporter permease [Oscillospiraceae bacterium]